MKFSPWRILIGACAALSFGAAPTAGASAAEAASTPLPSAQVFTSDDLCRLIGKAASEESAGEGFDLATQQQRAASAYWHCVGHEPAPVAVQDDREDGPWSATLYLGPASTKYAVATFMSLNMHPTGVMAGLAVDRKLLYLGYDISLAAEGQVTQYFFGHEDTTFA